MRSPRLKTRIKCQSSLSGPPIHQQKPRNIASNTTRNPIVISAVIAFNHSPRAKSSPNMQPRERNLQYGQQRFSLPRLQQCTRPLSQHKLNTCGLSSYEFDRPTFLEPRQPRDHIFQSPHKFLVLISLGLAESLVSPKIGIVNVNEAGCQGMRESVPIFGDLANKLKIRQRQAAYDWPLMVFDRVSCASYLWNLHGVFHSPRES
jgi:hypothetical protein